MIDYRSWIRVLGELVRELRYLVQAEVEKFSFELQNWVNHLVTRPLPADWRRQTAAFLLHWEREGFQLTPQSVATVEWWIEAWAARRGFLPNQDDEENNDRAQEGGYAGATTVQTIQPLRTKRAGGDEEGDAKADRVPDTVLETHRGDKIWATGDFREAEILDALHLVAVLTAKEDQLREVTAAIRGFRTSLVNQALGFAHFLVLDMDYYSREIKELTARQAQLTQDIADLKQQFSQKGYDRLKWHALLGDDLLHYGGEGLSGAREILRGINYAAHSSLGNETIDTLLTAWGIGSAAKIAGRLGLRIVTRAGRSAIRPPTQPPKNSPQAVPPPAVPRIRPPALWTNTTTFKGLKVYQRSDLIDPKRLDSQGVSSLARMKMGLPPIGPDGKPLEMHHMLQLEDGAVAEVTKTFHSKHTRAIHLNPKNTPSGIDRATFNKWRSDYWKHRAIDFSGASQ